MVVGECMEVSCISKSGSHLSVKKLFSRVSQYVCYSGNTASSCSDQSYLSVSQVVKSDMQ